MENFFFFLKECLFYRTSFRDDESILYKPLNNGAEDLPFVKKLEREPKGEVAGSSIYCVSFSHCGVSNFHCSRCS